MGNSAEIDASLIKLSMLALFPEMPSMNLHAVEISRPGKVENGEVIAELCALRNRLVFKNAGSQIFRDFDHHQVMLSIAVTEPHFGECARVGDIVHSDGQSGVTLDSGFQPHHRPAQIGSKDQAARACVCSTRQADSDALKLSVRVHFHNLPNSFGHSADGPRASRRRGATTSASCGE